MAIRRQLLLVLILILGARPIVVRGVTQSDDEKPTIKRMQPEGEWEREQRDRDRKMPQHSTVVDVQFAGRNYLSPVTQQQLALRFKGQTFEDAGWIVELRERTRDAYQQLGYFTAEVESHVEVTKNVVPIPEVVAYITVREGELYRLSRLRWENVTVFRPDELDALFPLHNGEIFNTEKVREGIRAVHDLYATKGYTNCAPIPTPHIEAEARTISLDIDADEGAAFKIGSVRVLGGDAATRQAFLTLVKPGDEYNPAFLERVFEEELRPRLPKGREFYNVIETIQDNAAHAVGIVVDLRSISD